MASRTCSVLQTPKKNWAVLREDLLTICQHDHCAALVLDHLIGENHKAEDIGETSFQATLKTISKGLFGLYAIDRIRVALTALEGFGFLSMAAINGKGLQIELEVGALNAAIMPLIQAMEKPRGLKEGPMEKPMAPMEKPRPTSGKTKGYTPDDAFLYARVPPSIPIPAPSEKNSDGATRARDQKDPDPDLRIDRWIEETAKATGKTCAKFGKKEREHLIASDTPELRENLGASIRCTLSSEVNDVVLQVAGFRRNSPRVPMQRASFRPPPTSREPPSYYPKRATTSEIHRRIDEVKLD